MLKNLFSYFGEKGILYKHPSDFINHRGTYTAVMDHKFAKIAKTRPDFGSLPHRSAIDMASYEKIDEAIKANRIMPYSNYDDMILLINFLVGVSFMLRGGKEHATLAWSNFRLSTVTEGKYVGRMKLEIVHLQDKSMSVSVRHPTRRDNTGCLDVVACSENKNTCVVHWYQYYRLLCPPTQERFYCYKAHNKLLKVSSDWFLYFYIHVTNLFYFYIYLIILIFLNRNINKKIFLTNPIPTAPLATTNYRKWPLNLL